jgi:hypothetical protein
LQAPKTLITNAKNNKTICRMTILKLKFLLKKCPFRGRKGRKKSRFSSH